GDGFDAAFDSFTYTVTDGYNSSVPSSEYPGLVTINLTNELPIAQPDSYDVIQNVTFSTTVDEGIISGLLPVINGDFDVDGDNLTPYLLGGSTVGQTNYNGSVILNSDGSFAYDPPAAWAGIDSFSYYINDGYSNSESALVTINVEVIREPVSEEASTIFAPVTPDVGDVGQVEGVEMANLQWLAEELGLCEGDMSEEEQSRCQELTQAYLAGAFLQSSDLRPHQAASQLRLLAELLHDSDGSRVTALGRVVEEFVDAPVPPSEEQISLIATALSEHTNDGTHYAAAGEWLDSLSEYAILLNKEIGWPQNECVEFVMGKYCTAVTESGDIRMAAFIQMHLEAFGG
ncbi:MAG: Ig-like domain-containing protein, partial [Planctomycetota bacterium]